MSENDSGTSEEQSADNEHVVAVVAHGDFGAEMLSKNAIKKVLEVLSEARETVGFEIDRLAYPDNGEMGGDVIQEAFRMYNGSMPDEHQIPGMPIKSPWDDTDGKDSSQVRERQDGTEYWARAPQFRDEMLARKADRLVVIEEGDFTDRVIEEFQNAGKPIYNHDIETMEMPDVEL